VTGVGLHLGDDVPHDGGNGVGLARELMRVALGGETAAERGQGIMHAKLAVVEHNLLRAGGREHNDGPTARPSPGRSPTATAHSRHPSFRRLARLGRLRRRSERRSSTHKGAWMIKRETGGEISAYG
jgi:hypothetical protein